MKYSFPLINLWTETNRLHHASFFLAIHWIECFDTHDLLADFQTNSFALTMTIQVQIWFSTCPCQLLPLMTMHGATTQLYHHRPTSETSITNSSTQTILLSDHRFSYKVNNYSIDKRFLFWFTNHDFLSFNIGVDPWWRLQLFV